MSKPRSGCQDDQVAKLNHCISLQIFSGRNGMSICRTPKGLSASTTALTMHGVDPIVPASPTPLTPIGFTGEGVMVLSISNLGK